MSLSENYVVDLPNQLRYQVFIQATWFDCEGEKWEYLTTFYIDDFLIAEYNYSLNDPSMIKHDIECSDLEMPLADCKIVAEAVSQCILKHAQATFPNCPARESYYGL